MRLRILRIALTSTLAILCSVRLEVSHIRRMLLRADLVAISPRALSVTLVDLLPVSSQIRPLLSEPAFVAIPVGRAALLLVSLNSLRVLHWI
jgi:hypothetical protein